MRAYIVGHGSIAQRHIRNLAAVVPDAQFIMQRPRSHASDVAPEIAEFVDSPAEAIAQGIDIAIVASATSDHIAVLPELMAAQTPMYLEKPVVATAEELARVRDLVSKTQYRAPSMVGCNLRFLPSLEKTRAALQTGLIGTVARAQFEAGQWLPDWRPGRDYRTSYSAQSTLGGGVVLDLIHEIDAARWLLGDFDRVQADLGTRSGLEIDSEDTAGILLSRRGGPLAVISLDYVSRTVVRRYSFVGDDGTLTWDMRRATLTHTDAHGSHELGAGPEDFDVASTYVRAMSELVRAIQTGTDTDQSLEEGLRTMDLAVRVKEANR
ncbi:Gfo/Idh/MocA family protein [Microbacterium sp. A93]|uniref:Gfo/Idh/MocA family protein n=1 Tax=Microbacterium sp. A93 TaxID=3450716 RepID=UPI003F421219